MSPEEMEQLITRHIEAEKASDPAGAVAVYTHDVQHDVVGSPAGPVAGKRSAQGFYEFLTQTIKTER
jgi:hypothetical protein